jgi:hypothetical protein
MWSSSADVHDCDHPVRAWMNVHILQYPGEPETGTQSVIFFCAWRNINILPNTPNTPVYARSDPVIYAQVIPLMPKVSPFMRKVNPFMPKVNSFVPSVNPFMPKSDPPKIML